MKKTFFVLACCMVGVLANAQSFSESFDTGPTGWADSTVTNFGNSGATNMAFASGTWVAFNNSVPIGTTGWFSNPLVFATHSGPAMANANFNSVAGTNTIDNFLMSPVRTFNNGDTISFWTRTVDAISFPDRLILKFSGNGASTAAADFSTTLLTVNPNLTLADYPNVWTQFSVTLTGLSGSGVSGRFAFNYNVTNGGPTGANSDFIGVDDVAYTANPVPEPASMAVLGIGALALIRRRRSAK